MNDRLTITGSPHAWRWQLRAAGNHRVIGASTEAYRRKRDALANALRVVGDLTSTDTADVWEVQR